MRIFLLCIALLAGCISIGVSSECDEKNGLAALYANNEPRAYKLLKNCANDSNTSGEALHQLHGFAFYTRFGKYPSFEERMADSQQLLCRAVHKGYTTSVVVLAAYYRDGDKSLGIKANSLVRNCLLGLQEDGLEYANISDVQACLSLNPDIDPTYECY